MTIAPPEPGVIERVEVDVDLDAMIPCQLDRMMANLGIPPCPRPAAWVYVRSCGCRWTLCETDSLAGRLSQQPRMVLCDLAGCPICDHCRKPTCVGQERFEPL